MKASRNTYLVNFYHVLLPFKGGKNGILTKNSKNSTLHSYCTFLYTNKHLDTVLNGQILSTLWGCIKSGQSAYESGCIQHWTRLFDATKIPCPKLGSDFHCCPELKQLPIHVFLSNKISFVILSVFSSSNISIICKKNCFLYSVILTKWVAIEPKVCICMSRAYVRMCMCVHK